ncbi:hypothetical protein WJX73_005700 [Symbiochloris irregularis]|uniref:CRAL-TRIO domain-containing protein n=1 Tax=Symbiochloris irregularis TaxID=706552 RepID=A0AAW1P5E5_9CHLO
MMRYLHAFQLLVYILEAATQQADSSGPGTLIWLVDFTGCHPSRDLPISVRAPMKLLQRHYPPRLGAMYGYRPSFTTPLLFKAVSPSLDAETHSKAHFVSGSGAAAQLADDIGADTLETSMGGNNSYQYRHDSYGTKWSENIPCHQRVNA